MLLHRLLFTITTAAFATGCFFDADAHDDYYYASVGTLVVDWTVAGTKDSRACRDFGVDRVDIILSNSYGELVDEVTPRCERFEVALDLPPDRYAVDAVLLDFDGVEVTTFASDSVRVYDLETSVSAVDFPEYSFR